MTPPSPNGRDGRGRFAPGWKGGPGNPHAKKIGQLRSALIDAVSPEDIAAIARGLIERAKEGDHQAAREILNRTLGRPIEADLLERLEQLEALAVEVEARHAQ